MASLNILATSEKDIRDKLIMAAREIKATYGDDVSFFAKDKTLVKYGRNESLGNTVYETVWLRDGDEPYVTDNLITTISSSDAGDTQQVVIEGHTVSGTGADAKFTFITQTATLNGQSKVTLATPLARATRYYIDDSTDLSGTIYIYQDDTITAGVPDNVSTKVHLQSDKNQSFKGSTTISDNDYWIILTLYAQVNEKTSASVDFSFERRLAGKVFRTLVPGTSASNGADFRVNLEVPLIIPKNADFRIRGLSSAADTSVDAWAAGYLAKII